MVDDELASIAEQLPQGLSPVRSVERVVLVDAQPGELTALRAELVAHVGKFLLFGQEALSCFHPFAF